MESARKLPYNGRPRLSWEQTALLLAYMIADARSPDPYVQVGATAILKENFSVTLGYNGAPSGVEIDWSDRDERRKRVLHAETNVLNNVLPGTVELLAVTHLPCAECIKSIAQKKIKKVVYGETLAGYDSELTFKLAQEFGIELKKLQFGWTMKVMPDFN